MIKTNFSATSHAASFIHDQRESKSFFHKEVVTRVVAAALPILSLFDTCFHALGMMESCIRAVIVKPGAFTDFHRHYKCVKTFFHFMFTSSIYAVYIPSMILNIGEDETTRCVNVMLLSKHPEYTKKSTVDTLEIVKYVKKHIDQMPLEDLIGMEEAPKLLADAKKYLNQIEFKEFKKHTSTRTTHKLSKWIQSLRSAKGSFFKTFLFKHCLARLLSLGLSLTSAIDLISELFTAIFILVLLLLIKLILNKSTFLSSKKEAAKFLASFLRDQLIHIAGTLTGSIIGCIDPDTAIKLSNTDSTLYRKLQFRGERFTECLLEDLNRLKEGESLLLPLSFRTENSGHIVYCIASKTGTGFDFSTLNTGYGSGYAENILKIITCARNRISAEDSIRLGFQVMGGEDEKHLANYTFRNLTYTQLSQHVQSIQALADKRFSQIRKAAKTENQPIRDYTFSTLYPMFIKNNEGVNLPEYGKLNVRGEPDLSLNPDLMFAHSQTIGDCPKSSLLAALNFSSSRKGRSPDHRAYDRWVRRLEDRVYEQDGYLIDNSLTLRNRDRKAKKVAKEHLEKRWRSYAAKYMAA